MLCSLRIVVFTIALSSLLGLYVPLGISGFVAWLASYVLVFTIWFEELAYLVRQALRGRVAALALTAFFLVFYGAACFDPLSAHFETLQQVECALTAKAERPDAAFNSLCFIGYPTRQYYLSALPSLLFGPSSIALNFGGFLYFALGLVIFAAGLSRYLGGGTRADLATALVLTLPPHWYWLNHSLVTFEQAGYPFCLGMLLVGAGLRWRCTRSIVDAYVLTLVLFYLAYSYTPGVALLLGAIPAVIVVARSTRHSKETLALLACVVCCFFASLWYRSLNLFDAQRGLPLDLALHTLERLARQLMFQDVSSVNWSPEFHPFFLAFVAICLTGILGWREQAMGAWIVATIVACVYSKGHVAWRFEQQYVNLRGLFRISVVLPVFSLMLANVVSRMTSRLHGSHLALIPVIGLSLAFGLGFMNRTREGRLADERFIFGEELNRAIGDRESIEIRFDPALPDGFMWPVVWRYYVEGFFEQTRIESCASLSAETQHTVVVLLVPSSPCATEARESGQIDRLRPLMRRAVGQRVVEAWCLGCKPTRERALE